MSVYLPNGSLIHLASGYGDAKVISAITNANPGVVTSGSTSHGVVDGDIIEVTSGWSRLNDRIVRVDNQAGDDFELEGINTTDTTIYPAGSGTGTFREITGWTQLQQIMNPQGQGGEQQFTTFQFLEDDVERRLPTAKSAAGLTLEIGDDDTLAGQILAETANDDGDPRACRITKKNGGLIFFSAIITLAPMPNLTINEVARQQVTFSFENPRPTKYAS